MDCSAYPKGGNYEMRARCSKNLRLVVGMAFLPARRVCSTKMRSNYYQIKCGFADALSFGSCAGV